MSEEKTDTPSKKLSIIDFRSEERALIDVITRASTDPNVDIAKMERLLDMYEHIQARSAERIFAEAMNEAQGEMKIVAKDARNDSTRSKYATYAKMDSEVRDIYTKHGFSLSFNTGESKNPANIKVLCYVYHKGGHKMTYECDMPCDGRGPKGGEVMSRTHATGSAMTYGQRYLLKLIFNMAVGEDDDGNAAGRKTKPDRLYDLEPRTLSGEPTSERPSLREQVESKSEPPIAGTRPLPPVVEEGPLTEVFDRGNGFTIGYVKGIRFATNQPELAQFLKNTPQGTPVRVELLAQPGNKFGLLDIRRLPTSTAAAELIPSDYDQPDYDQPKSQ
jgi:ERF superfamily protein